MNKFKNIRRQKGVFAIEFALGFIVLFMFTMLIFETCRLTYICSVLDYATAEAARDARVQLKKNPDYAEYRGNGFDCSSLPEPKKRECEVVQSFKGDEFQVWFHWFVEKNGGVLWKIMSAENPMAVTAKHYRNLDDLVNDNVNSSTWKKNSFSLFEVSYFYQPIFFKWSILSTDIRRHALVIDEFERHRHAEK